MKSTCTNRILLSAFAIVTAVAQSSCSTSSNPNAWAKIQSEGLIPFLVESHSERPERMASEVVAPAPRTETRIADTQSQRPFLQMHRSGVVTAQKVAGKPGFVYSPHTPDPLEIDVRDFQAGASVLCPYTKKSFVVPGVAPAMVTPQPQPMQIASRSPRRKSPTNRFAATPVRKNRSALAPNTRIAAAPKQEEPKKIVVDSIHLDPKPIIGIPKNGKLPTESDALALPKKEEAPVPVGKRVEGKPNYVYSPFAASNQVVDVEGHAAGTKVKCPYTGKVFAVPAPAAPADADGGS